MEKWITLPLKKHVQWILGSHKSDLFLSLLSESRGCSPFQRKHKDKRHVGPCNMALGIFIQKYITNTSLSRNCTSLCYGRPQETWKQKCLYWKTYGIEKLLMFMKCLFHASLSLDQLDSLPQFLVSCLFCFVFLKSIHQSPTSAKHCVWPWKTNMHTRDRVLLSSILFCFVYHFRHVLKRIQLFLGNWFF